MLRSLRLTLYTEDYVTFFLGKDALYSVSVEVCDIQSWALMFQALTISVSYSSTRHKWVLINILGAAGRVAEGKSGNWPKGGSIDKTRRADERPASRPGHVISQTSGYAEPGFQAPLCMQLGQTAVVCDAFSGVFLDLLFPKKTNQQQYVNSPDGWISSLATLLNGRNETLNQGLLTLYTGFVSRKNGDAALINRSAELYSNGLHALRGSDIIWVRQKPSPMDIGSTLASIIIFSRVELLAGEGANGGYMAHIKGAKKEDPNYLTHKAIEAVIALPTICEYADRLDAIVFLTERKVQRGLLATRYLLSHASVMERNLDRWLREMAAVTPCPIATAVPDGDIAQPQVVGIAAAQANDLWMLHWSLEIRFNLLIKQLQTRFTSLSALFSDPVQLPGRLTSLGKDYSILDLFANYIKRTLARGLGDNTLQVQGAMAYFFNLHWYWEQRGNAEQKNWCLQRLQDMTNNQRLALDVQVVKDPQKRPSLSAAFFADDFI
ncbi:uncharacterized protein TRIVIDRAFT_210230 [Trichoderma virens Gv29-8]|uniref:Uncharacterized protein n=1 Tax=Hypocrea virens (strain Gv29-8 / FGSC 10586) TaxID=413071 RepID=G9N663_HYPVG|nr:uncharacterized protein TRIVIDRAFT_210230 [Trichoderma virens Gv29-8]EHK17821.1 hypothetical protein TRIVIDRAFT_210230 [Trichoderma virens Gv29-8]